MAGDDYLHTAGDDYLHTAGDDYLHTAGDDCVFIQLVMIVPSYSW